MSGQAKGVWCCSKCGAIYHKDYPRCPADGAEIVLQARDPLIGQRVDQYVVDAVIGEGGMGRVYRAHHAQLAGKQYALKVLLGDVAATASMRKRFEREAESASRLDHPNLVPVIDFGATPHGLPYIAMELVDGPVLTDLIDQGPMLPARVVNLARQICEGLAYAHDAGLVHRDLKPDNIIIATGDVPRITDFGLVLPIEHAQERLTSTGMAMGTPAYAAPEQMQGKVVDLRADLFSLGLSMFELLTGGMLPWEGSPMEIAAAKTHKDAPTIQQRAPKVSVPADLQALIARLLSRDPAHRPGSARELIGLLDDLGRTPRDRTQKTAVPTGRIALWAGAVAIAAVAVGFGAWAVAKRWTTPAATAPAIATAPATAVAPPTVAAAVPATPTATAAVATEPPELEMEAEPARPKTRVVHKTKRLNRPKPQLAVVPVPETATELVAAEVVAPPPKPIELHAAITSVEVHGALPAGDVERAVRRTLPVIERCKPAEAQQLVVQMQIGEARRAENVHASGGSAGSCVAGALAAVRTEAAPDVGDVEVTVRVEFAEKP